MPISRKRPGTHARRRRRDPDGMTLASLDWALRGAIVALVLLLAVAQVRDHWRVTAARLGAAFALGTAAYAVTSAAGFSVRLGPLTIPLVALSVGNNSVFWTFSAALFDDGFRLRWWHGALWLAMLAAGFLACIARLPGLDVALTLSSFVFALLAALQALSSWRADLIERRRRLRLFVVAASSFYIAIIATAELAGVPHNAPTGGHLAGTVALLAIVGVIAVSMLKVDSHSLFPALAETPKATVHEAAPP